ncbi:MAG: bifunctional 5,10-methylenetetrahydrofolate dehydrogenase/5,10-methenyltetrahydrofolate cyclohydrolase [Acidimicrobiales bacterium]
MPQRPTAQLMSGTELARTTVASAALRASEFQARTGRPPGLTAVLVGDDPASVTYVSMKQRRAASAGISSQVLRLPTSTSTDELVAAVAALSADPIVDGILVQHPLPSHVDERAAFDAIDPAKDVDGVTMRSLAAMALGLRGFVSATPGGIMRLLASYGVKVAGMHAVVIGRSPILGKPVGLLLLARDATVTFCHSKTANLPELVRSADLVVAAVGRPQFVRGDWLKPGAVVVDAGYNEGNVGDVHFEEALAKASLLTPVPGGVGPMTIALLLEQTVSAGFDRAGLS